MNKQKENWGTNEVFGRYLSEFSVSKMKGTLRDEMGSELGGRFRMGDTCTLMADLCQCMAKTTTLL